MNIFMMVLVALFMVGFYMISSPSQRITNQETEYAINRSDLRSVAQCAAAAHNAALRGYEFDDICAEQNSIVTQTICLNSSGAKTKCEIVRSKKPDANYIITATGILDGKDFNEMMEILEADFADSGTFGIFQDGKIISGGTSLRRSVPRTIVKEMNLTDGQLVYLTQYEMPDNPVAYSGVAAPDILCPAGTVQTYRFNRWQCVAYNTKTNCAGDMIWDSDLMDCVPDDTRKPLCAEQQTAVLIDSVWECINPFPSRTCPEKMVARLNYTTLEWECVADPNVSEEVKKCTTISSGAVYGVLGSTLRVSSNSCTDCEKMITDMETCTSVCVPDPSQINNPSCYPDGANQCNGNGRAFYFGFPNYYYISNVSAVEGLAVPMSAQYSKNRKFNCMDCGERGINQAASMPPYTVVCN